MTYRKLICFFAAATCPLSIVCLAIVPTESAATTTVVIQDAVSIDLIDGKTVTTSGLQITPEGQINGTELTSALLIDDIREITFNPTASQTPGPYEVRFRGGSVLFVRELSLGSEQCKFVYRGKQFEFPIESIAAVRLDTSQPSELFETGVNQPLSEYDKIYIRIENQLQAVTGVIDSIESGTIRFLFDDSPRELSIKQVYGIVVADFAAESTSRRNATVAMTDGSVLNGRISELTADQIVVIVGDEQSLELTRDALQSIKIRSDRLAFLSDMEPIGSEIRPIVTARREWQRDLSVDGNPLSLFDPVANEVRVFQKGIGTHAETRLDFSNSDGFDRLSAVIGIDAETGGKGDCEFVVLGDDRELLVKQMTATDEPFNLDIDVTGVSVITLLVRAGNQLDLADHANWCEARLLRTRSSEGSAVGQ